MYRILFYALSRWQDILKINDLSFQSLILLIIIFLYILISSMTISNFNKKYIFFLNINFIILSLGIKIIFFLEGFKEKEPFELVYVVNDISTYVFIMCSLKMISLYYFFEKESIK